MLLFLDFSGGEFFLIAIVFLMFFGSKSIPGIARTIGKAVREFKDAANNVQREIHESASVDDITKPPPLKESEEAKVKSEELKENQPPNP